MIDQDRVKRNIGATLMNRGPGYGPDQHYLLSYPTSVVTCVTNGVDNMDVHWIFTTNEWDKLQAIRAHTIRENMVLVMTVTEEVVGLRHKYDLLH